MSLELPQRTIPGQPICPVYTPTEPKITKYTAGPGTKLIHEDSCNLDVIVSTRVGDVTVTELPGQDNEDMRLVEIRVGNTNKGDGIELLPKEGDIVLCRVIRLSLQRANVEIIGFQNKTIPIDGGTGSNGNAIVGVNGGSGGATFSMSQSSSDLGETFRGIVRSQDVRAVDRDKVKMIECFKPGDIIKAQVLSLGDGNNYYLTTARNDLGVVFARSDNGAGGLMYATDWQTMVAPITGAVEKRKCAKPF
ncbi:exosome non-catalytic core subunit CSL4 KNAG_0F00820 [Huiozyma naganishii CBS 8797]|uniref:Uncharacterized protein n=1 Tax=Huiozyma naganishii (strain ATCC MYA-139 / BCRC 22969 / CBS 8797 / KCTC 17520 / NBRC 10181 / NCYC 3082 / Yp74L-3) TaxID=1071383 RepID=J7S880_HUIN7|nr:hypothetical protein KNAG_0F00820 [Kazachstania naganishii CBS 8797]CCK70751.1 hypothetical protein KNAG_0F00820 [Kazachstania naganishii CBS 8797]